MTCASTRLFFPCAIAGLHVSQTLANNVHTVSTTRGVAHAPSGTSKTKEQDRCFLFCQKASIARKQAQLSCQNYTWGRVGIKPLGAQRTAKTTSAALVAPRQEDIGSKVANV